MKLKIISNILKNRITAKSTNVVSLHSVKLSVNIKEHGFFF